MAELVSFRSWKMRKRCDECKHFRNIEVGFCVSSGIPNWCNNLEARHVHKESITKRYCPGFEVRSDYKFKWRTQLHMIKIRILEIANDRTN